jgi:hypothetical protein
MEPDSAFRWILAFLKKLRVIIRAKRWVDLLLVMAAILLLVALSLVWFERKLTLSVSILLVLATALFIMAVALPNKTKAQRGKATSEIPRRRWLLVSFVCVAVALALTVLLLARKRSTSGPPFAEWGLPLDFPKYGSQLTELSLEQGCQVSYLTWLPPSLKSLRINCLPIRSLKGLPENLASLNVRYTGIESLDGLPETVTWLDISNTGLAPASLDELNKTQLCRLDAEGVPFSDLSVIPRSVRVLRLQSPTISDLGGLPQDLVDLSIGGTVVESFAELPETLRSLSLKSNKGKTNSTTKQTREVDYLPQYIRALAVDTGLQATAHLATSISGMCISRKRISKWPEKLKSLRITSAGLGVPLPKDLDALEFEALDPRDRPGLADLPKDLRRLRVVLGEGENLGLLPRKLVVLDLSGSLLSTLNGLPDGLQSLDVSRVPLNDFSEVPSSVKELIATFCSMPSVTEMPQALTSLNLSGCDNLGMLDNLPPTLVELNLGKTNIASLPSMRRLTNLRRLDISNTRIGALPELPEGLEELTLSLGRLRTLKGLPSKVKRLRFIASTDGPQKEDQGCWAEPSLVKKHGSARDDSPCG